MFDNFCQGIAQKVRHFLILAQNRHDLMAKIGEHIDGTSGAERGCNTDWTLACSYCWVIYDHNSQEINIIKKLKNYFLAAFLLLRTFNNWSLTFLICRLCIYQLIAQMRTKSISTYYLAQARKRGMIKILTWKKLVCESKSFNPIPTRLGHVTLI